jgi:predicted Zn finger-like uncharacterized protein
MIVHCDNCGSRFHLADGRVGPKGAKVRCSNCHHRFYVAPPGRSRLSPREQAIEDSARELVAEAAAANSGRLSGPDPDLDNPEFLFDQQPARRRARELSGEMTLRVGAALADEDAGDPAALERTALDPRVEPGGAPPLGSSEPTWLGVDDVATRELPPAGAAAVASPPRPVSSGAPGADFLPEDLEDEPEEGWARAEAASAPAPPVRTAARAPARSSAARPQAPSRARPAPAPVAPEAVAEAEEPADGWAVRSAAALVGLALLSGALRLVWVGRAQPGPQSVSGQGWSAESIQSFHVRDPLGERVLVIRGELRAERPGPPPRVAAVLVDSRGAPLGDAVAGLLARLDGVPTEAEPPAARLAELGVASEVGARGFTVLVPRLDPRARRFRLELQPGAPASPSRAAQAPPAPRSSPQPAQASSASPEPAAPEPGASPQAMPPTTVEPAPVVPAAPSH